MKSAVEDVEMGEVAEGIIALSLENEITMMIAAMMSPINNKNFLLIIPRSMGLTFPEYMPILKSSNFGHFG